MQDNKNTPIMSSTALIERFKRDFDRDVFLTVIHDQHYVVYASKHSNEPTLDNDVKNWLISHGILKTKPLNVVNLLIEKYSAEKSLQFLIDEKRVYTWMIVVMFITIVGTVLSVIFND